MHRLLLLVSWKRLPPEINWLDEINPLVFSWLFFIRFCPRNFFKSRIKRYFVASSAFVFWSSVWKGLLHKIMSIRSITSARMYSCNSWSVAVSTHNWKNFDFWVESKSPTIEFGLRFRPPTVDIWNWKWSITNAHGTIICNIQCKHLLGEYDIGWKKVWVWSGLLSECIEVVMF